MGYNKIQNNFSDLVRGGGWEGERISQMKMPPHTILPQNPLPLFLPPFYPPYIEKSLFFLGISDDKILFFRYR